MAWSTPLTAVANATLTAAQWNASVRDNLLETSPALATTSGSLYVSDGTNSLAQRTPSTSTVSTSETSTSTTYTDLATSGPAVSATTGPAAIISVGAQLWNSASATGVYASVAVSGATTSAASDTRGVQQDLAATNQVLGASRTTLFSLTAGANTFTMKYRVLGGTGNWRYRELAAIPL